MTEFKPNRRKDHAPYYLATTDYFEPNHAQLSTAVKGRDVLNEQRRKRRAFWGQEVLYGLLVLFILVAVFAALFVIAAVVESR